jgi:hypothetical protein
MKNKFIDKTNGDIVTAVQYTGEEEDNSDLLLLDGSMEITDTVLRHRKLVTLKNFVVLGITVGDWLVVKGTHFDIIPDEYFHRLFQPDSTKLEDVANYYDKVNKQHVYITQYTGHRDIFEGMEDIITFSMHLGPYGSVSLRDSDEALVIKPGTYVKWDGETLEKIDPKCFQFERLHECQ